MKADTTRTSLRATNDIVCHCRQIDRPTIERCIQNGANSLEAISCVTGAGIECGCCQVYIKELLGEELWLPVRLASIRRYSDNYCAFRFVRTDGKAWNKEQPGAYFIFQTRIDGIWVGRPYAITDDGVDSGCREVVVKRKSGGFFSNWLFDHLDRLVEAPLRISASVGGTVLDSGSSNPVVALIGGVGITPVLALCRMLAKTLSKAEIYIDYSASSEEDFFCREELLQLARHCDLSIHFRQTLDSGRIKQADVDAIVKRYPGENYYVCGPDSYKTAVIDLLRNRNVTPKQIIDLESSHTKAEIEKNLPPVADFYAIWGYRIVGFLLLLAYCLQDAFDFKLAQLEQLQSDQGYKIFSGVLLLMYVLMQWRLPIARWLKLGNTVLMKKKHRHKYFGAIAPLVFYLHATNTGYAYLAVLSGIYLANNLIGYGSGEFIGNAYKKAYVFGWTILHVSLATGLLFLSGYHAYIALAYK